MDHSAHPDAELDTPERPSSGLKRKRSDSNDAAAGHPSKKSASSAHLQINYLARQNNDDLPLVSQEDSLPTLIASLSDYAGVLERHESMAVNLGARPLGPILIHRFERLFDGPPRVLKSHGKEGTTVTWLDVVEFARNKPEQFQLGQMSEGARVCQFYTKQCRVQISEDDFVLINSGIPQKMIPPQPISEDEEKELGTIEILEKTLGHLSHLADQVAVRTRQLNHRLKGRKQAILDRRAQQQPISGSAALRASSPSNVALMNGASPAASAALAGLTQASQGGFVAVNSRPATERNGNHGVPETPLPKLDPAARNSAGASPQTHAELLNRFSTVAERKQQAAFSAPAPSPSTVTNATGTSHATQNGSKGHYSTDYAPFATASDHPATGRPSNTHMSHAGSHPSRPSSTTHSNSHHGHSHSTDHTHSSHQSASQKAAAAAADEGPYKASMVSRMETLQKGDRILPPCDRCRRLHMDCLKNLTACMGCTKKHAKCSWREVKAEELQNWDSSSNNNGSTIPAAPMGYGAASATDPTSDRRHSVQSDRHSLSTSGITDGYPGFRTGLTATDEETYVALQRENQRARDEEGLTQARALAFAQLQAQNAAQVGLNGSGIGTASTPLSNLNASAPLQVQSHNSGADAYGILQHRDSIYSPPHAGGSSAAQSSSSIPASALSEASFRPLPTSTTEAGIADIAHATANSTKESFAAMGREEDSAEENSGASDEDTAATATAAAAMARAAGALSQSQGYSGAEGTGGGNQGVTA